MDSLVFAAVLIAAAAHAGWNAAIKRGLDPLVTTVLIAVGAGAVALPILAVVGLPAAPARPWVIASVVVHLGYFAGLIEAYRAGDMSQVYPIARGSAPLLTALVSTTWLGERLGPLGWVGLLCLVAGVMTLSLRGGGELARLVPRTRSSHRIAASTVANFGFKSGTRIIEFRVSCSIPKFAQKSRQMLANFGIGTLDRRAVGFALFTALTVCAYSVIDGVGVRAAGDALAYTAAVFLGNAVIMALYGLARRGAPLVAGPWQLWRTGLGGGALQFASYGVALWAMTVAPIAVVAALRETSVLFGALIAVAVLREPLRAVRVLAAVLIVAGLVMIKVH
jgi:drug/metabolite transporter (DMT)-like permease